MMTNQNKAIIATIEPLICRFCDIILTEKDCLNYTDAESFIISLTPDEKSDLNLVTDAYDAEIRSAVLRQLISYLRTFDSGTSTVGFPFAFDHADNFSKYREHFTKKYNQANNNHALPYVFCCAFDYIQSTSEHYRIFEQFYSVRSLETTAAILSQAHTIAKEQAEQGVKAGITLAAQEAAENAAKTAASQASAYAKVAAQNAEDAMKKAQDVADEAVKGAVEKEIGTVTNKVSETSVTILGIFSGIVLTVVAGLFYSSSVLRSINSAHFCRLICISSLIGLVSYHLIALMFRFVERIKDSKTTTPKGMSIFISIVLLVIFVLSGILQFFCYDPNYTTEAATNQTTVSDNAEKTAENEAD